MKESIYTIPISEVFEPKCGCPLCTLAKTLELRWVQYITGAAMMEPDVRLKTNEEGFCAHHLGQMMEQRNRLSVALLLQTRLEYVLQHLDQKPIVVAWGKKKAETGSTCFVCNRIGLELHRLADNLAAVWAREESFRTLYREQEYLCFPHYELLARAGESIKSGVRGQFLTDTAALVRRGIEPAKADIDAFCKLFDYRSNGAEQPSERVSAAVERAAALLTGGDFTTT